MGETLKTPRNAIVPPDASLRFSVATLLLALTVASILAFVFREQAQKAQSHLLVLWSIAAASFVALGYLHRRSVRKRFFDVENTIGGEPHFVCRGSRTGLCEVLPGFRTLPFQVLFSTSLILLYSWMAGMIGRSDVAPAGIAIESLCGITIGGGLHALLKRRPHNFVALLERGVTTDATDRRLPWSYIRDAQWLVKRPNVLRLHRLDGDILVEVPAEIRDEVETFVKRCVTAAGNPAFGQS